MNLRAIAVIILILFSVYTLYVMVNAEQSLLSFSQQQISSPDTAQVVLDLYIMAFLAIIWMYYDSRQRGKPRLYTLPFAILTLVFVSIGPLLYIALRPGQTEKEL